MAGKGRLAGLVGITVQTSDVCWVASAHSGLFGGYWVVLVGYGR